MSKKIKVGDKIVFGKCKKNKANHMDIMNGITIGKIYAVTDWCGEPSIEDNDTDIREIADFDGLANITKIIN